MIKKETYVKIGEITFLVLILSNVTWYITATGEKTACRAGWQPSEEMEGYWECITQSGVRYQMCFEVYDSANTENYWCKKGEIVKEEKQSIGSGESHKTTYHCNNKGCF